MTNPAVRLTAALLFILLPAAARGDDKSDAAARAAFTEAWQARHDTKTDRAKLALALYRDGLVGANVRDMAWPYSFLHPSAAPFPATASAQSILRGEHGDASIPRLLKLTENICLDMFTESHEAIVAAIADDLSGDDAHRQKASFVLFQWMRRLSFQERTAADPAAAAVDEQIERAIDARLYPVAADRFQHAAGKDARDVLSNVLVCIGDPRAIPILLGKNGDDMTYFEDIAELQRGHSKADPALLKLLTHADPDVRAKATDTLWGSTDPDIAPRLIKLLGDKSPAVRYAALQVVRGLPAHHNPELDARCALLLNDPDPGVRFQCITLLMEQNNFACAPAVLQLLRDDKTDERTRAGLIQDMTRLTGVDFGYHNGRGPWPTINPDNIAALDKFAGWIAQHPAGR